MENKIRIEVVTETITAIVEYDQEVTLVDFVDLIRLNFNENVLMAVYLLSDTGKRICKMIF